MNEYRLYVSGRRRQTRLLNVTGVQTCAVTISRIGITHHRNKRKKAQVNSVLREIPGIGESTEQKLIKHFKSVKRVKQAPVNELIEIVGQKNAKAILKHFGLQT